MTASQAFAFFTGTGPFLGARPRSGIEPPEMLNVPRVLDGYPVRGLQARGARPRNMNNLERALPHGRELVQSVPGENPPEHEVSYLESSGAMNCWEGGHH